jgi:hypothetical protein
VFFLGRRPLSDPALEVADFIMHAVGRQARHRLQGQEGFVRDFAAVFHTVDAKLASFSRRQRGSESGTAQDLRSLKSPPPCQPRYRT